MVTRSIVGRFLILAVLLVSLGVIAQAALIISKDSGKTVAKAGTPPALKATATAMAAPSPTGTNPSATQVAAPASPASAASPDAAPVRVVYPGPLGDAPVTRKIADAAPASPLPNAPAPPPVTANPIVAAVPPVLPPPAAAAPVKPGPVVVATADPAAGTPAAAEAPPATKGGVNLNSASVDVLNHLGGGHIGQTIVQHRPYRSVEDLVKKRVVRRSVYDQIKNQVAAD